MKKSSEICNNCGTENEPIYTFCKNCGAPLDGRSGEDSSCGNSSQCDSRFDSSAEQGGFYDNAPISSVEGIPVSDMAAFVGKKAPHYIPKFITAEASRQKHSWLWPPAILSFIFGPFGAALWFFYRKMSKIAVLLVALGMLQGIVGTLAVTASLPSDLSQIVSEISNDIISGDVQGYESNTESLIGALETAESSTAVRILSQLNRYLNLAVTVVVGVFSCHFYKCFAAKSIRRLRTVSVDPRYYRFALASSGGTSGGMLALGIVIPIAFYTVISFALAASIFF